MKFYLPALAALFLSTALYGQNTTTLADAFAANFPETNVGFLHVYADPDVDPLETYLMRGTEMNDVSIAMLPGKLRRLARRNDVTFYGAGAIKGQGEDFYLLRTRGEGTNRIDMLVFRNGRVKHLKRIAYLDCGNGECLQMDSYITDVNLDTDLDLITIARRTTEGSGTTDEKRTAYVMPTNKRKWKKTTELDVPWEGITFYEEEEEN